MFKHRKSEKIFKINGQKVAMFQNVWVGENMVKYTQKVV
jgi:hypothetical protein